MSQVNKSNIKFHFGIFVKNYKLIILLRPKELFYNLPLQFNLSAYYFLLFLLWQFSQHEKYIKIIWNPFPSFQHTPHRNQNLWLKNDLRLSQRYRPHLFPTHWTCHRKFSPYSLICQTNRPVAWPNWVFFLIWCVCFWHSDGFLVRWKYGLGTAVINPEGFRGLKWKEKVPFWWTCWSRW